MPDIETPEMQWRYSRAMPGDDAIFTKRLKMVALPQHCNLCFNNEPGGVIAAGDWWTCTRVPGHVGDCVSESFDKVLAVCDGQGKEPEELWSTTSR